MKRNIYDVIRWYTYLYRHAAGLLYADESDNRERRLGDELFARIYAGKLPKLQNPNQKDAEWANSAFEKIKQTIDLNKISKSCKGNVVKSVEATKKILETTFPSSQNNATTNARDIADGLDNVGFGGLGHGGKWEGEKKADERAKSLAERLKDDERLKKIALLAGKFKRISLSKQKMRVRHGADEISDVTQGNDIARLLPTEIIRLTCHNRLRKLAVLRDLMEYKCLQYQMTSVESLGRGPLILCIDKSGSMEGDKDVWASAVSLALLERVHKEHRTFILLGFNESVFEPVIVKPGRLFPEKELLFRANGGTDIGNVLDCALLAIEARSKTVMRRADIVLVTDGQSSTATAEVIRERAKNKEVRILGIGIGVPFESLSPWCDEVCGVTDLTGINDNTAVALFGMSER